MLRSRLLPAACAALLIALPAAATSVLRLTPAEVDALAARILVGRCVSATTVAVPGAQFPATEYVFQVEAVLKDDGHLSALIAASGGRFTFRQVGGERGDGSSFEVPGVPRYEVGTRYRLALAADSVLGLTSPVGLAQGAVALGNGAAAPPLAVAP